MGYQTLSPGFLRDHFILPSSILQSAFKMSIQIWKGIHLRQTMLNASNSGVMNFSNADSKQEHMAIEKKRKVNVVSSVIPPCK